VINIRTNASINLQVSANIHIREYILVLFPSDDGGAEKPESFSS
jgi:hypothetical protein